MKKIIIAAIAIVASCATSAAQIYLWNDGKITKGYETPNYIDSLTFEHIERWYENWYGPDDIRKELSEWNEMHLWKNNKNLYTAWPDSVSFSYINLDKYSTPTTNDLIDKYESAYDPMHWYDWGFGQYNPLNVISGIMTNDFYVGGSNKDDQRYWHKMAGLSADASNNLSSVWEISYEGIMRANAIERLVDDEDYELTDGERKLYKAEANFLRNYYYAIIWKWWGNIPYSKTATSNETLYNAPQCDATIVGDNIAADLETTIESDVLPMRWAKAESGRISKAAAIMLYTDVIMYNTASEKFAENKKKAKDYLLQIVSSGEYSLNPDYAALWEESGEWCAESILEVNYDDNNNKRGWSTPLAKGGTILPTFISPNGWPGGDGWNRGADGWGFFPMRTSTLYMYKLSDARRDATCWDVRGVEYYERYQDTHIWLKKYRPQSANNADAVMDNLMNYNNNLRIYRYAETLLWLSELTEDAKYMNMVRKRAGLADTEYSLEAVIEERHLEFVGENKRYWDLVRTGMAAKELKANVDNIDDRGYDWTELDKYLLIPESAMETAKRYGNALKQNNPCPYDMSEILEGSSFKITKDNSLITFSANCSPLSERYYLVDEDGNETLVSDNRYICLEAGKYTFRLRACYRDMYYSEDYVERNIDISKADIEADAIYAKDYEDAIKVSKKYNQITAECSDGSVTVELYMDDYNYGSSLTLSKGDYIVKAYVRSSKGVISKDYLEYEFTISDKDLFTRQIERYIDLLANKTWRIDYQEYGHLGCGPSGTDGTDWWSAEANYKADYGVYDDRITFERGDQFDEGTFTYDPGVGGTVYVNYGCKDELFAEAINNSNTYDEDVMVDVEKQTSTFAIVADYYQGSVQLYLQLAPKTFMPYISGDEAFNNPLYRIESLTNQRLVLVCDYGEVAWRMVFTSSEEEVIDDSAEMDWNTASSANLWNAVEFGDDAFVSVTPWMSGPGWGGGLDPDWARKDAEYIITLPEGIGGDQWMGQFHINTTLTATQNKKYNFYCVVEADADAPGVTIKLTETDEGDTRHDNNFFFQDRHDVKAFKPFIYKAEGVQLAQNDAHALSLIFDFGGTPEGTTIKISEIYFEEAPDYNDENNLWKAVDAGDALVSVTPWMSDDSWSGGLDPEWKQEGNVWTVVLPEGLGNQQWQGQFPINTTIAAAQADSYRFSCTIEADNNAPGVTIKLTETDEGDTKHDNNFFFQDRHNVKAFEPFVYYTRGVKLNQDDAHALSLLFDFGGTPGGTEIKISNIILEKE